MSISTGAPATDCTCYFNSMNPTLHNTDCPVFLRASPVKESAPSDPSVVSKTEITEANHSEIPNSSTTNQMSTPKKLVTVSEESRELANDLKWSSYSWGKLEQGNHYAEAAFTALLTHIENIERERDEARSHHGTTTFCHAADAEIVALRERVRHLEAVAEARRGALEKIEREVEKWYDQKQYAPTTFANIGSALADALAAEPEGKEGAP